MKNICTLFVVVIVLLCNARLAAQSPAWAWAHVWAGNSYNVGNCVTTDAAGNVYVGGEFFSSSIKSPGAADTARNSGTRYDFFIARYTASGSLVWLKSFGSPAGDDKIQGIAADADGNIFITGNATGSTLILGEDTLTGSGTMVGTFIARLDASGNVLWARQSVVTSATGQVNATSIAVDAANNVIASGTFTCPDIAFGSTTLSCVVPMYNDMYMVKYDASGNFSWAKSYGGINSDLVYDIATDLTGNICFTGYFNSPSISFGSVMLTNSILNPNPIFIAKADSDGNILWASSGEGNAVGTGITTDPTGNIIITGFFTTDFVVGGTTLTSLGAHDLFLAKYNGNGTLLWAKRNGSPGVDRATAIASDASGNLYITGYYNGSAMVFGDSTVSNLESASDLFVARYNPDGTSVWGMTAKGGTLNDYIKEIAVDNSGNHIYITGYSLNDTMKFGDVNMIVPPGSTYEDAVIAKIELPVTKVPATSVSAAAVRVYPNPAKDIVTIDAPGITEVSIADVNGKVLLSQRIQSDCVTIDVSTIIPGIYSVIVVTSDGVTIDKLIKQ